MKRVLPILLILLVLLSSACFAAYEPDPSRWIWLGSDDEVGWFIDKETVQYFDNGNTVSYWVCQVHPQENIHYIVNEKISKSDRTVTVLHLSEYDDTTNKVAFSHTYALWEQKPESIIPGTWGEALYRFFFSN
ncbi:MAG: hypothetical protein IJ510_00250 [Selenomonadales bacterium]|nr:hypothetical protein [Selenomonadales bacterium]